MAIDFQCTEDEDDLIYKALPTTVRVTGGVSDTPATFADFVTADRAGNAVLLEPVVCSTNHTLEKQIRPVEALAIQITFTLLGGTSAGGGDTLDVTGTDWRGAAQNESIDVSGGDGAYTGAKYWRTITDIDCTGWADGGLKVEQDRWGMIWDHGNGLYTLNGDFLIGDNATPTYFASELEAIVFTSPFHMATYANAVARFGVKVNNDITKDGCFLHMKGHATREYHGKLLLYGSLLHKLPITAQLQIWHATDEFECINVNTNMYFWNFEASLAVLRLRHCMMYSGWFAMENPKATILDISDIQIDGYQQPIVVARTNDTRFENLLITNSVGTDLFLYNYEGTAEIVDSTLDWVITSGGGGPHTGKVQRLQTCNIHVTDKDGANLANVTVLCEDEADAQAFSVSTDANGEITEQEIEYKRYEVEPSTVTTYSPHKFILSKAGYETLVLENVTIDAPIVWHLTMKGATGPFAQKQWR